MDRISLSGSTPAAAPASSSTEQPGVNEPGSSDSGSSSWWGFASKWVGEYRKDLDEFVGAITKDTMEVLESAPTVGAWISSSSLRAPAASESSSGLPADDPSSPLSPTMAAESDEALALSLDPSEARRQALRRSEATFLAVPSDLADFTQWRRSFVLNERSAAIREVLAAEPTVRTLLARLVPDRIPYESFWLHYFYKLAKLDALEERRRDLLRRVESADILLQQQQQQQSRESSLLEEMASADEPSYIPERSSSDVQFSSLLVEDYSPESSPSDPGASSPLASAVDPSTLPAPVDEDTWSSWE